MRSFLITAAVCVALLAIVPVMVWGGTGSWRRALDALREYLLVLGLLLAVGGGLGVVAIIAAH